MAFTLMAVLASACGASTRPLSVPEVSQVKSAYVRSLGNAAEPVARFDLGNPGDQKMLATALGWVGSAQPASGPSAMSHGYALVLLLMKGHQSVSIDTAFDCPRSNPHCKVGNLVNHQDVVYSDGKYRYRLRAPELAQWLAHSDLASFNRYVHHGIVLTWNNRPYTVQGAAIDGQVGTRIGDLTVDGQKFTVFKRTGTRASEAIVLHQQANGYWMATHGSQ